MKIKIYISKHCALCNDVMDYFRKTGLDVVTIDVTHNQERFDEMMKHGGIATPSIIVDDQIFHTFDRKRFDLLLEGKR